MSKSLGASQGLPSAASAETATRDRERFSGPGRTPGAARYVPPSVCERCIPVIRFVEDGYDRTITEAAHEPGCPNHPTQHSQTLKESTW
jgi:hypothetical protein